MLKVLGAIDYTLTAMLISIVLGQACDEALITTVPAGEIVNFTIPIPRRCSTAVLIDSLDQVERFRPYENVTCSGQSSPTSSNRNQSFSLQIGANAQGGKLRVAFVCEEADMYCAVFNVTSISLRQSRSSTNTTTLSASCETWFEQGDGSLQGGNSRNASNSSTPSAPTSTLQAGDIPLNPSSTQFQRSYMTNGSGLPDASSSALRTSSPTTTSLGFSQDERPDPSSGDQNETYNSDRPKPTGSGMSFSTAIANQSTPLSSGTQSAGNISTGPPLTNAAGVLSSTRSTQTCTCG